MLKCDTLEISVKNCRKLKYFNSLGYDTTGETIKLKISDLNKGSRLLIKVICDYCGNDSEVSYKEYNRNISIGGKYACCKECGSLKAKETNLNKWGVENPMCLTEIQEKVKKTNLNKYGVEYLQQSDYIKEKTRNTFIEKWGVDHISKTKEMRSRSSEWMSSDEFKIKSKNTLFKNYNVDNPSKSEIIKEKIKNTISNFSDKDWDIITSKIKKTKLDRWGDENYNNVEKIKESFKKFSEEDWLNILNKSKSTKLDRWGDENYNNVEKIKESFKKFNEEDWLNILKKRKDTNFYRYGIDCINKSEYFRSLNFEIAKNKNYIKYIDSSTSLFSCEEGHDFEIKTDNYFTRNKLNLPLCTICNPIGDLKSIKEKELFEFIKSIYEGEIIQSYRDNMEIDIYLPELKLGFEFNGLYWHSEEFKEKNYHINKTSYFKERGIRIIHIWEDDWVYKRNILESQIRNWLGLTENKIFARNCYIKEIVDSKIAAIFLNENHIQGKDISVIKLGLYYNDELVSLMTFNKSEGRKKMVDNGWNLSRFCNVLNTNVIGSGSKILKQFIKKYNPSIIVSYADKDWSNGNLYFTLGFKLISENNPDYKYIVDNKRVHKSRYKKSRLNTNLTESQYMRNLNIYKIYDCGKIKFERKLNF